MEITLDNIIEEVSEVFNCEVSVMKSPQKFDRAVTAKQAAILLIRKHKYHTPLSEIALLFRYKTETSVSKANRRAWDCYETDKSFKDKILKVERKLISNQFEPNIG